MVPNDQVIIVPIDLSVNEEAEILLKQSLNSNQTTPKLSFPICKSEITLSLNATKSLQSHFLSMRSSIQHLPLKFNLSLLTKLTQISAISQNRPVADSIDA